MGYYQNIVLKKWAFLRAGVHNRSQAVQFFFFFLQVDEMLSEKKQRSCLEESMCKAH